MAGTDTWLTSANKLLLKKAAITGVIAFLAVFIPAVLTVLDEIEGGAAHDFSTGFWFSLLAGAIAAALRAILALSPLNLVPTDALNSIGGSSKDEVVVSTKTPTASKR